MARPLLATAPTKVMRSSKLGILRARIAGEREREKEREKSNSNYRNVNMMFKLLTSN